MSRIQLTNELTGGTVEVHTVSVKDNFFMTIPKFNIPKLVGDSGNMVTKLVPLLQGSRNIEVMGYIHVDMFNGTGATTELVFESKFVQMLDYRTKLINFASKNAYTYFLYTNMGTGYTSSTTDKIQGYIQGLEFRETPTGTPKPSYLLVTFNIIEGVRI